MLEYRHWRRGVGDMGSGVAMGPRGDASTLRAVPRMAAGMGSSISCPKYLTPGAQARTHTAIMFHIDVGLSWTSMTSTWWAYVAPGRQWSERKAREAVTQVPGGMCVLSGVTRHDAYMPMAQCAPESGAPSVSTSTVPVLMMNRRSQGMPFRVRGVCSDRVTMSNRGVMASSIGACGTHRTAGE